MTPLLYLRQKIAAVLAFCVANLLLCASLPAQAPPPAREQDPHTRVQVVQSHMGMLVRLTVWAPDQATGRAACRETFELIDRLNMILSDYEPQSELSKFVRQAGNGPLEVSEELFTVLSAARTFAGQTRGLYDPTAAPVIRLWRKARQEKQLPDPDELHQAMQRIGYQKLVLDEENRTAELKEPGMQIDLGAIAKGYVGDRAIADLKDRGLPRAAFEAGGDFVLGDAPPGRDGWEIDPEPEGLPTLTLENASVAISGDQVQFVEIGGRRYSHVIDPRTGEGVTTGVTCMVVAPVGIVSDSLATLGTLMPPDKHNAFVQEHYPEAQVHSVRRNAE